MKGSLGSIFRLAILLPVLFFVTTSTAHAGEREDLTIRHIARTLDRLGETIVAKRLIKDYFERKVISFGDVGKDSVNAETGKSFAGGNTMVLDKHFLLIADSNRILNERPWSPNVERIPAALTVLHEYVHMAQHDPKNVPKFEDPAYKAVDSALARWAALLQKDFDRVKAMRPGPARDRELRDLADLVAAVHSETGSMSEAVIENQRARKLNYGIKFKFSATGAKLSALLKAVRAEAAKSKSTGSNQPVVSKPTKGWVLVSTDKFFDPPSDANYKLTAGEGSITWRWSLNKDVFGFTGTWTKPPAAILPTDRIPITVTCAVTENVGEDYSANGTFVVWIDTPTVKPGFVERPTSLKTDAGETAGYSVSHRTKGTPTLPPKTVWIEGKALGVGADGARFAILVDAYIGRNAGVRYVYEWKELPKQP